MGYLEYISLARLLDNTYHPRCPYSDGIFVTDEPRAAASIIIRLSAFSF